MRVLVLGGMHGNELLGVELVRSLQESPIVGVDVRIANQRAVERGVRFTETDLNRSFGGKVGSGYEAVQAKELTRVTRDYDVVLDFHNTQTSSNNCAFVGVEAHPILYDVAKFLGYRQIIQATYDCINRYCPNTISMEISVGDAWDDIDIWRDKIGRLRDGFSQRYDDWPIEVYRFLHRITWSESRLLSGADSWRPFVGISEDDKLALGVEGEVVPIFIGSRLTEYYATLLTRI